MQAPISRRLLEYFGLSSEEEADLLNNEKKCKFLPNAVIPDNIECRNSYEEVIKDADIILHVTPSKFTRDTVKQYKEYVDVEKQPIVICSKGIEKDTTLTLDEVINVYVGMWNSANFANTVSFNITYVAKIDDNGDGFYQGEKGLNFDLNTGEKIAFQDVFTADAPMEDILRKSAYYSLISYRVEDNLAGDLVVSDYGDIENEIVEIINLYRRGKITEFWYTPKYINILYKENQMISINMEDFAKYITIYSKYLSENSIYVNDDIGIKDLYTLANRHKDIYYYENYQNRDNYFIEISINFQSEDSDEFAKKITKEKIGAIEKEIEKVKQKASENPNRFYILNYHISIYTGEEWSTKQVLTNCWEYGNAYEMSVHDFEKNIEPIIMEYNRADESGGIPEYIYNFSEKLKIEPQTTTEYYNPETGEKIVI